MSTLQDDIAEVIGTVQRPSPVVAQAAHEAANSLDRAIALWQPPLQSADADILPEKETIDARVRDVARNDAYVRSGLASHKDSIVGSRYALNAIPSGALLGMADGWEDAFQEEVEALWELYAESPRNWMDAARGNTFTELVRLIVGVHSLGGEALAVAQWSRDLRRPMRTCVQIVDADRLSTPPNRQYDADIRAGIRRDKSGAPLSYFIRTKHPSDLRFSSAYPDAYEWKELAVEKPWGRQQVFHIFEQSRPEQARAVSDIVAGLKAIKIASRFRDVTLQNAVVGAMYAATIESELPSETVYSQLGGGNIGTGVVDYAQTYLGAVSEYVANARHMQLDGIKVPHLFPGTKFKLTPAGTPGGVGQDFEASLLRHVAASLNISYEELSRDFSKTNYSSMRAAILLTWRHMQAIKMIVADKAANAMYRLFLEEAVNQNLLSTFPARMASKLYDRGQYLGVMFDAFARAEWIGAARGQVDELKETQAAVLRIKYALSTHEDELSRMGKDWRKQFKQLRREKELREEYGIELTEDNSVNAASGAPRDQTAQDGSN